MRNLTERVLQFLKNRHILPVGSPIVSVVITAAAAAQIREPRCEPDDKPFFQVERLKKNFLHQLKRFAEWFEDLNHCTAAVHSAI